MWNINCILRLFGKKLNKDIFSIIANIVDKEVNSDKHKTFNEFSNSVRYHLERFKMLKVVDNYMLILKLLMIDIMVVCRHVKVKSYFQSILFGSVYD